MTKLIPLLLIVSLLSGCSAAALGVSVSTSNRMDGLEKRVHDLELKQATEVVVQ